MKRINYSVIILIVFTFSGCAGIEPTKRAVAPVNDDYKYTQDLKALTETGYERFKEGKIMGKFNGGYYTDPNPHIRGYEFWFNGKMVKVDRDHNGHYETIFMWRKEDNALVYVGSIGTKGLYVDAGEGFEPYLGHYSDEPFLKEY